MHWMLERPAKDDRTGQSDQSGALRSEQPPSRSRPWLLRLALLTLTATQESQRLVQRLQQREASPHGIRPNPFATEDEAHERDAAFRQQTAPWPCMNGHEVGAGNNFCGKCGCPRERPMWPVVEPTGYLGEELTAEEEVEAAAAAAAGATGIRVKRELFLPCDFCIDCCCL